MILRNALSSDFEQIRVLFAEVYNSVENKAYFNWPDAYVLSELAESQALIAVEGVSVLGVILYRDGVDAFEIMALATSIKLRRQGLMQQLIAQLLDYSRKASKRVLLEVHSQNIQAIALYEKVGFVRIGSRRQYYPDGADALVYQSL